jgi:hypothetical protein
MNKQKEIDAKHGQLAVSFCFFDFYNFHRPSPIVIPRYPIPNKPAG